MADQSTLTSDLNLANHTGKGIWQKNIKTGVLAQLATADPEIKVGATDMFTFTTTAKAELVGEGAAKGLNEDKPTKVTAKTYKVHVTYRYSDEVMYEDEDYQLGLVDALVGRIGTALSRALDLLAIHGINPKTGNTASISEYLTRAGNNVHVTSDTGNANDDVLSMAEDLQGAGYSATGIAFDPKFAGTLARTTVGTGDSRPLYPELGLGFNVSNFQGITAASSDTVSARQEVSGGTGVQAIMADWDAFKWGVARTVPLELIQFGDPDGSGDLKRQNEVAIRAESYLGFAFMDTNAFALVQAGTSS